MDILIAPDSFKESLTALEVAENLERGLRWANSNFNIKKLPMADGGEGTVESLVNATGGRIYKEYVTGPLDNKVEAFYGILGDGKTAVLEMAAASGLPLVSKKNRNPAKTTTYGTGELIKAALDKRCNRIIIGIGGSATIDCGVGMTQALGGRFLDREGNEVGLGGENLIDIKAIDLSELDERIEDVEIEAACDVINPLYGENGASYVYGPQKGATREQIKELDKGLKHISRIIKRDLNKDVANIPGAGAAGGLGSGLLAFLDADLRPGIDIVIEASNIKNKIKSVDLVITGEGKLDGQTIGGKTPIGVAKVARENDIPVIAVAGTLGANASKVYENGIDAIFSIIVSPMELEQAMDESPELLTRLGKNLGKLLTLI